MVKTSTGSRGGALKGTSCPHRSKRKNTQSVHVMLRPVCPQHIIPSLYIHPKLQLEDLWGKVMTVANYNSFFFFCLSAKKRREHSLK